MKALIQLPMGKNRKGPLCHGVSMASIVCFVMILLHVKAMISPLITTIFPLQSCQVCHTRVTQIIGNYQSNFFHSNHISSVNSGKRLIHPLQILVKSNIQIKGVIRYLIKSNTQVSIRSDSNQLYLNQSVRSQSVSSDLN